MKQYIEDLAQIMFSSILECGVECTTININDEPVSVVIETIPLDSLPEWSIGNHSSAVINNGVQKNFIKVTNLSNKKELIMYSFIGPVEGGTVVTMDIETIGAIGSIFKEGPAPIHEGELEVESFEALMDDFI